MTTSLYLAFGILALLGIVGAVFAYLAFSAAALGPRRKRLRVFEVVFQSEQVQPGVTKSVGQLVPHGWEPDEPWKANR